MPKSLPKVVFLGAGHATLIALKHLAGRLEADVTLVSESPSSTYSGMVPGWIEGIYSPKAAKIPLAPFAKRNGAKFLLARAVAIDADWVTLEDGKVPYDILAVNIGAATRGIGADGAPFLLPAKPLDAFVPALAARLTSAEAFCVIGAGAAGLEIAFALKARRADAAVHIIEREKQILRAFPKRFAQRVEAHLASKGIALHVGQTVASVSPAEVTLGSGACIRSDVTALFTGATAPPLLDKTPFARSADGFLAVDGTMRSQSHPNVIAVGDIATNEADPRPKSGVYSVRAGPPLAKAVRALVSGETPATVTQQRSALVLLSTGGQSALGTRNGFVAEGRWVWRFKDYLDRSFVDGLTVQQE